MARLYANENFPFPVVEELHRQRLDHRGIVACTYDPNFAALAKRIDAALANPTELAGQLIRVNRPPN